MSEHKELREKLFIHYDNGGNTLDLGTIEKAMSFCEDYKDFLNAAKTERECVKESVKRAEQKGFVPFDPQQAYRPGDKVYLNYKNKSLLLAVVGTEPLSEGVHIAAAHLDCPRLDFKPKPLYEEGHLGLFKTHYYGGLKKYQWTTIPLAIHGVVIKADGEKLELNIGEKESDPVFVIGDLLPHLAAEQMKKTLAEGVTGEQLNVIGGSLPYQGEGDDKIRLNVLNYLYEEYGMVEEDFISADIEVVPAFKARDIGFDRSLIGAYGHDDRVCAYTALMATLEAEKPAHTVLTVLADREEIGSCGVTGMKSDFFMNFLEDLCDGFGISVRRVLDKSRCLSADVSVAYDPSFPEVYERRNSAHINHGTVLCKYTGARGKSSTSEASAELMGEFRRMFNAGGVLWQTAELGKVDAGGGGTVASYIAERGIETVDLGVAVLSMHAPYECVSKIDTYMTFRAFQVFYES